MNGSISLVRSWIVTVFITVTFILNIPHQVYCQLPKQTKQNKSNSFRSDRDVFIEELLLKMTLEEKLGQLNLLNSDDFITGQARSSKVAEKIAAGKVGGLFNIKGVQKIKELQRIAVEESRLKIPMLFAIDLIHGYRTVFPIPLGLSCTWDPILIEQSARIGAIEATADGFNWAFSPMLDICRDPRWGRIAETSGEDPTIGSMVARAMVKGYQGNLKNPNELLACMKHFALYGAAEGGRDYNTVDMSHVRMFNEYLPPFKAAVDAGVGSVMTSFNEVDGVPATANTFLLQDVLRKRWGFKGLVISDYTGVNEMISHGMGDLQQVSALALKAGLEMDMVGEGFLTTLGLSLKEGKVSISQINAACKKVLSVKYDLGLFKDPYKFCDAQRAEKLIFNPGHRKVAREIAAASFVLLKNEGDILPLRKTGKIAIIGPLGNNKANTTGTWSVSSNFTDPVTIYEGMKELLAGKAEVSYAKGSFLDADSLFELRAGDFGKNFPRQGKTNEQLLQEALQLAQNSDVIIATIGESAEMSGESSSRTNLNIPEAQQNLIRELMKTGKPVVLVLFTGRPLTLQWEEKNVPAILNIWFPGTEAGYAVTDVLFGDVNPSGKLTATFPQNVGQIPIYYSHKNTGRPLPEGKWFSKFTSNYLDVSNEPLYPFGFGLSYTHFDYQQLEITPDPKIYGSVHVSVELKNIGSRKGTETVQLYIRDLVGSITRPVKELKAFKKVELLPNETRKVMFTLNLDDFRFYNPELKWVFEPGEFKIMVGGNSADCLEGSFLLKAAGK